LELLLYIYLKKDVSIILQKIYNLLKKNGLVYLTTTLNEKSEEGFFTKTHYI